MNNIKWYPFYNNPQKKKEFVLIRNETIYPHNVLIAKKTKKTWLYTKFTSLNKFIKYFANCNLKDKKLYAILTSKTRYLYLDIDYKLDQKLSLIDHELLISTIEQHLKKFITIYGRQFGIKYQSCNCMIWDASRLSYDKTYFVNKFSLHIIDTDNVMHYLDIKLFAEKFSYWLMNNNVISNNCVIDTNIYHDAYQPWRLPYNHNGDIRSLLKLYNNKLDLFTQFQINTMANIQHIETKQVTKQKLQINHKKQIKLTQTNTINNIKTRGIASNLTLLKLYNIPQIYLYPKLQKPTKRMINKISEIFKVCMPTKLIKHEYILTNHYCPILKAKHKRNSGRLLLLHIPTQLNSEHCVYTCMDEECRLIMKKKFITLSNKFVRPWLMYNLHQLQQQILIELDTFIDLLIKTHVLLYNQENEQSIIKSSKLQFDDSNIVFSTFINDKITHNKCNHNNMSLSYRAKKHQYIQYGTLTLYCRQCKSFVNMKNNQLV